MPHISYTTAGLVTQWGQDKSGCHFADNIFKLIFFNEYSRIFIKIWLKFVPEGSLDNMSALVQTVAWCWAGDKSLPERMLTQFIEAYASPDINELTLKVSNLFWKKSICIFIIQHWYAAGVWYLPS